LINLKKIRNSIEKKMELLESDDFQSAKKRKSNHNHVEQTEIFKKSKYFLENNTSKKPSLDKKVFERKLLKEYNEYMNSFQFKKDLKSRDLSKFPGLFLSLMSYRVENGEDNINNFKKRFNKEEIIKVSEFLNNPESESPVKFQKCLSAVWSLIYLGLPLYGLSILNELKKDLEGYIETKKSNFSFLTDHPHTPRAKQSIDWCYSWIYRQLDEKKRFIGYLDSIIKRHPIYNNEVEWFVGKARIIEASALKYQYNKTDKNLKELFSLIEYQSYESCKQFEEHLEETLLILTLCSIVVKKYPYKYE